MQRIMECVGACGLDRDRCVAWLKEKCADLKVRAAREGGASKGVLLCTADTTSHACILEVTCETDFGALSSNFLRFTSSLAPHLRVAATEPTDALLSQVQNKATESLLLLRSQLKENIEIPRVHVLRAKTAENGQHFLGGYAHSFGGEAGEGLGQFGAIVHLHSASPIEEAKHELIRKAADSICRHMIATSGLYETQVIETSGKKENVFLKPLGEQKYMGEAEPINEWLRTQIGTDIRIAGYVIQRLGR